MDLQCFYFSDVLGITGVEDVPDISPRSLNIFGTDFRSATRVLLDDQDSPSWIMAGKTQIIAQVPDTLVDALITSVQVLSSDFTATVRSKLIFELGNDPRKITGLKAMMQTFLKILFTTPGTDAFAKKIGGGALQGLGKNFSAGSSQNLVSDFSISVRRAETQMIALQSRQLRLPDDEKLAAANVLGVTMDVANTSLLARVELIAQSGKMAITALEL